MARRHALVEAVSSTFAGASCASVAHELVPGILTGPPGEDASAVPDSDVLVAAEVAQLLRMNVKTVYELARAGELPCWRLGQHFRFSRGAIVARLAECKAAPHRKGK